MSTAFDLHSAVIAFHAKFGATIGTHPEFRDEDLRISLIDEELQELVDAVKSDDLVGAADALGDLLYVVMGSFVAFGIDPGPVMAEIQRSNMSKTPGHKRADGKIQKGPEYSPPDLYRVLGEQMGGDQ